MFVVDILSDKKDNRQSTPIKPLPVNMIGTLDLGSSSVEALKGSQTDLVKPFRHFNTSSFSASTFETNGSSRKLGVKLFLKKSTEERAFTVKIVPLVDSDEEYYEEPDTPCSQPHYTQLSCYEMLQIRLSVKKSTLTRKRNYII